MNWLLFIKYSGSLDNKLAFINSLTEQYENIVWLIAFCAESNVSVKDLLKAVILNIDSGESLTDTILREWANLTGNPIQGSNEMSTLITCMREILEY